MCGGGGIRERGGHPAGRDQERDEERRRQRGDHLAKLTCFMHVSDKEINGI